MCLCHVVDRPSLWPLQYVRNMGKATLWCACWVGLGILFSVGLSIGLHTFFLYLVRCRVSQGPHYECGLVDFPNATTNISLWTIISKVRLEACMWVSACYTLAVSGCRYSYNGLAARLSGTDPDDKDTQKSEEMLYGSQSAQVTHCSLHHLQLLILHLHKDDIPFYFSPSFPQPTSLPSHHLGSLALLRCIPNLLLDLAGITWTFSDSVLDIFGATLIRKAVIKMHIQKLFVIVVLSRRTVEQMVSLIGAVPLLGAALQKPFSKYLEAQKAKLHHHTGEGIPTEENWLSWLFEKVVVIMVCFFVCSIVNSMAQS
uniref:Vacuole membrane protein 1 n=1 Tax=Mastacembelus armatus TaxID=205130 RepID=A0A3Q3L0L5_9TELE